MGVSGRRGWLVLDRLDNTVVRIVFGILGLGPHVTDDLGPVTSRMQQCAIEYSMIHDI